MARLNINSPSKASHPNAKTISRTKTGPLSSGTSSTNSARSYRTQEYDSANPFQEPIPSAPTSAPTLADTIAASTSSSSISSTSRTTVTTSVTNSIRHSATNTNKSVSAKASSAVTPSKNSTISDGSHTTATAAPPTSVRTLSEPTDQHDKQEEDTDNVNNEQDNGLEDRVENPLIYLTPSQREAAIENLEIETMDRIQKLRASIGVLTSSLKFRAEAEMNRLPAAIRTMTVEEFWFTYNGSAKEYLEQQAKTKTVANTAFLHALSMVDQKRKRDTPGPADELWQQKKKNRDEQRQKHSQAAGYNPSNSVSSSSSSSTSHSRPPHQPGRHNEYAGQQQQQQQRRTQSPFIGSRSVRGL